MGSPYSVTDISKLKKAQRSFSGGEMDRLTADFRGTNLSPNQEIFASLYKLRGRSRQLCMDNDYAKRFLGMVKANVVGANGIALQSSASQANGKPDSRTRKLIESHWKAWGQRDACTMSGRMTWRDVMLQVIETVARDGECLIQVVRGKNLPYGMALHVLEADYLDHQYNEQTKNRMVTMGVEHDAYFRPIAYHLHKKHPSAQPYSTTDRDRTRVPANELIHVYVQDRPTQMRGVPWFHTAIRRLNMLGKYEEAEQVAAREAASKMGFFTSPDGMGGPPTEEEADGTLVTESQPGAFDRLPDGVSFTAYDPTHPTSAFSDFIKAVLRGAASGLGVSYNTLANDLEGVNFSSIRSGVLEEREQWRSLQQWFIDQFCQPVYAAWLSEAIKSVDDLSTAAVTRIDRMREIRWQPRGWPWVDPLKDQQANREALSMGVMTRRDMAAAQGKDLEEIFEQLRREEELAQQYGLDFGGEAEPSASGEQQQSNASANPDIRQIADAYGIGVRAGMITPQMSDENFYRDLAGLPPISEPVSEAWNTDGGVRRPITLKSGEAFDAEQEQITDEDNDSGGMNANEED